MDGNVLIVVIALVVAVAALFLVRRVIDRMTLGTFLYDDSGNASYSGVFEFERSPEEVRGHRWALMRVRGTDLSLPNERNRRNDSSFYGGFDNSEERGKANER